MSLPEINNSRLEQYLSKLARGEGDIPAVPQSRAEQYLDYLCKNGSLPAVTDADNGSHLEVVRGKWAVVNDDYFCITVNSDLTSVTMVSIGLEYQTGWSMREDEKTELPNLEYSIDKKEWIRLAEEDEVTVNKGTPVYFRGINDTFAGYKDYYYFVFGSDVEGQSVNTKLSGNIMSLINGAPTGIDIPKEYCFKNLFSNSTVTDISELKLPAVNLKPDCYWFMFYNCTSLVNAPELPATALAARCYSYMFNGCTSLVNAPELPATTLAANCYEYMFSGCTSLVNAPELLAIEVEADCYQYMFNRCTALVNVPELSATTLAERCYQYMFSGCTSLVNAPELPATTLASGCYSSMFNGCTALVNAPELPATTLASGCYSNMFSGCTSLVNAPELPAIEAAEWCYQYMFNKCRSLVNAPELPATTLAEYCYSNMFSYCTSLVNAPELPATTLAEYCYQNMFSGCTSLNSDDNPITLPAIELVTGCYQRMFKECSSLHRFDIYFKNFVFPLNASTSPTLNWLDKCANVASVRYASYFDKRWENSTSGIPGGWSVTELPA